MHRNALILVIRREGEILIKLSTRSNVVTADDCYVLEYFDGFGMTFSFLKFHKYTPYSEVLFFFLERKHALHVICIFFSPPLPVTLPAFVPCSPGTSKGWRILVGRGPPAVSSVTPKAPRPWISQAPDSLQLAASDLWLLPGISN